MSPDKFYGLYVAGFVADGAIYCIPCAERIGAAYGPDDIPPVEGGEPVAAYSTFEESDYPTACDNYVEAFWGRADWCEQIIDSNYISCCDKHPDCGFDGERHDWLRHDMPKPTPDDG